MPGVVLPGVGPPGLANQARVEIGIHTTTITTTTTTLRSHFGSRLVHKRRFSGFFERAWAVSGVPVWCKIVQARPSPR